LGGVKKIQYWKKKKTRFVQKGKQRRGTITVSHRRRARRAKLPFLPSKKQKEERNGADQGGKSFMEKKKRKPEGTSRAPLSRGIALKMRNRLKLQKKAGGKEGGDANFLFHPKEEKGYDVTKEKSIKVAVRHPVEGEILLYRRREGPLPRSPGATKIKRAA